MSLESDQMLGAYRPQVAAPAVAVRPTKRVPLIHIVLFAVTFATVALNGALNAGADPFTDPWSVRAGFPFAIALMSILLIHELGHYTLARWHNVSATLPYFIRRHRYLSVPLGRSFACARYHPAGRRCSTSEQPDPGLGLSLRLWRW